MPVLLEIVLPACILMQLEAMLVCLVLLAGGVSGVVPAGYKEWHRDEEVVCRAAGI
jgi:hypothetical protein